MAIENRFTQADFQPVPPSDAYEVYWTSTEDDTGEANSFPSPDPLQLCKPGDAYNELWQLWDAQW